MNSVRNPQQEVIFVSFDNQIWLVIVENKLNWEDESEGYESIQDGRKRSTTLDAWEGWKRGWESQIVLVFQLEGSRRYAFKYPCMQGNDYYLQ